MLVLGIQVLVDIAACFCLVVCCCLLSHHLHSSLQLNPRSCLSLVYTSIVAVLITSTASGHRSGSYCQRTRVSSSCARSQRNNRHAHCSAFRRRLCLTKTHRPLAAVVWVNAVQTVTSSAFSDSPLPCLQVRRQPSALAGCWLTAQTGE